MTDIPFTDIATVIGAVVTLSLALSKAIGSTIMFLTEVLKEAFNVPSGKGGLVAIGVSVLLCGSVGVLTPIVASDTASTNDSVVYGLIGCLAGILVAAGAVESHKASATVNTEASTAIQALKVSDSSDHYEAGFNNGYDTAQAMNPVNIVRTGDGQTDDAPVTLAYTDDDSSDDGPEHAPDFSDVIAAGPGEVTHTDITRTITDDMARDDAV